METDAGLRPEEFTYHLPEMGLILPLRVHRMQPQVLYDLRSWVRSHIMDVAGMDLEGWLDNGYDLWTCHSFPHAHDDRILKMARWAISVTVMDEETTGKTPFTESIKSAREAVGIWEGFMRGRRGSLPREAPPWWHMAAEAWNDIVPDLTPGIKERWIEWQIRTLRGTVTEIGARGGSTGFDHETYMELRRDTVYGWTCWLLAEYGLGIDISWAFTEHPEEMAGVMRHANDHLIIVNDLFSLRREFFTEKEKFLNRTFILRRERDYTLQKLVERYCAETATVERSYVRQCREILSSWGDSEDLRSYLKEVGHCMAATLHFSRSTSRYHGIGFLWNGIRDATMTMLPDKSLISPAHRNRPDWREPYLYRSPLDDSTANTTNVNA
jgi:hypothetical protein